LETEFSIYEIKTARTKCQDILMQDATENRNH